MNILHLITSPRGENSLSFKLGEALVDRIQTVNPGSILKVRNLAAHPLPHLEIIHISSFFTPKEYHTNELAAAVKLSDSAIQELVDADVIVIDTPMYNLTIPSTLKTWIDHVVRVDRTFVFTQNGPEGILKGKKVYLAIATGSVYSEGPMKGYDFTESYLRAILGFVGIRDITAYRVEGTTVPELKENALTRAVQSIELHPETFTQSATAVLV